MTRKEKLEQGKDTLGLVTNIFYAGIKVVVTMPNL